MTSIGRWSGEPRKPGGEEVYLIESSGATIPAEWICRPVRCPHQRNGWVTLGSLNNYCKVNEPLLKLWARVLGAMQDHD